MGIRSDRPLVTIRSLAFNHEKYIRKCLEGIIMQRTNFTFEAIIHDDCSTDRTTEILTDYARRYPQIIKPIIEKENLWSKHDGSISRIMNENTRGKYIAWCECDDYWTDPYKLQKEVDILESNPDVQLVYTGFQTVDTSGNPIKTKRYERNLSKSHTGKQFIQLIKSNYIQTLTVCARAEVRLDEDSKNCPERGYDWSSFLYASLKGKLYYIDDITGCYRINPHGMMISKRYQTTLAMKSIFVYYASLYCTKYQEYDNCYLRFRTKLTIVARALDLLKGNYLLMKKLFSSNKELYLYIIVGLPICTSHVLARVVQKILHKQI